MENDDHLSGGMRVQSPRPLNVLRCLWHPLYDRVTIDVHGGMPTSHVELFVTPLGMKNRQDAEKNYADTNMVMCGGMLPTPVQFDLFGFRLEPCSTNKSFRDWMTYYHNSDIEFGFGANRYMNVPLSWLPFSAVMMNDEQMKSVASVLANIRDEKPQSNNDLKVLPNDKAPEILAATPKCPWTIERMRTICRRNANGEVTPFRLRSQEHFRLGIRVDPDQWRKRGLSLEGPITFRLYMEGYLYLPV